MSYNNSALFQFYCNHRNKKRLDSTSNSSSEAYDDSTTTTTECSLHPRQTHSTICEVTLDKDRTDACHSKPSSRSQLLALFFDIYCLLNGFFRSLLDSNSTHRGKCPIKEDCAEMTILDILQRIMNREILVDEKCRKYPALIPMLTAINRKFQQAEGLFCEAVEETQDNELVESLTDVVENMQNYFECMQVMSSTEKEVESDLQEILCYLDHPLMADRSKSASTSTCP